MSARPAGGQRRAIGRTATSTVAPPDDVEPSFDPVKDHDLAAPAARAGADEPAGSERPELEARPAAGAARGRRVGPARVRRGEGRAPAAEGDEAEDGESQGEEEDGGSHGG